jgi:hypothetical protein
LAAAHRAEALAKTPAEAALAFSSRARLECYAGHHQEELRQAKKLVRLEPKKDFAWVVLLMAARCNHLEALEQQAERALEKLHSHSRQLPPLPPGVAEPNAPQDGRAIAGMTPATRRAIW